MESEVSGILVAAHELKAPLNLMRQLAFSLESELDLKERKNIHRQMIDISDRAIKQVNDLSKIARLEEGLFEMAPVSARGVCDEVTRELKSLFIFNKRSLDIKYTNRERLVIANHDLLYSVIYNFCVNAAHYSGEQTKSCLTVKDYQGSVRISVRDYGPALPMDVWREMKRGWLKKPTSIAMRPGSSGLGLFIASKFSKYMNARVGAIRHRDGTSFFVELQPSKQLELLI